MIRRILNALDAAWHWVADLFAPRGLCRSCGAIIREDGRGQCTDCMRDHEA